ncbi:MAG TPA: hypothetical protein VK589_25705 [Chryseolinea sp.]|nr:hypothetical protein [Chryseolinea sp.]
MRTINLLTLLLTTITLSFGQNFEGKITYKNEYKSKAPNVTDEQFTSLMGKTWVYYIKEGDYKTTGDGTFFQWQLYINKDNKVYNKMSNSLAVLWNDGAVNPDEVIKSELNKGVTNILGYQCDELILTCKSGVQKYYFSPKLKVNANLYEKHKFGNWDVVMAKTNGLPLKMIIESPQFSMELVATEVTAMKLEDKLFELPADSKLEKSPY